MGWPDLGISLPKLPTLSDIGRSIETTARDAGAGIRDFGAQTAQRATELGRAGVQTAQRGVEAVRNFDVREAASTVRREIGEATEAGREGIATGVRWTSERVGEGADLARSNIQGDSLLARGARAAVTAAETNTRFGLGVTGGVAREVVGLAGTVGQLSTTGLEMQVSHEARVEYTTAAANFIGNAGSAVGGYAQSVVQDPSRLGRDAGAASDAVGGFVGNQLDRYQTAIAEGRGAETIGMDVGTIAANVVPIGGGPVRGAVTTAVREGTEAVVREGAEAVVRGGTQTAARETTEVAVREAVPAAATRTTADGATTAAARADTPATTAAATADAPGADLVARAQANGGTIPLEQGAGRVADIAAASRQSGSEIAVYRDLATGERRLTVGTEGAVQVPGNSRIIAHTQPGTGPAALTPSAADQVGLAALGQRSSAIIDDAGALGRFQVDDALRASQPRAGAGDAVTFNAPRNDGVGGVPSVPSGFANADDFARFGTEVRDGLQRAGYPDVEPILQGSAVTGHSFRTGEAFDVGRASDFDVALAGPSLLDAARNANIGLRSGGTRTGPLSARDLHVLGLRDLSNQMGAQAGRDVNFMVYGTAEAATARAPSVVLPK